jgi:hypothetical protein
MELRRQIAAGRPVDNVDMEAVFMTLTGRRVEEDEEEDQDRDEDEPGQGTGEPENHDDAVARVKEVKEGASR